MHILFLNQHDFSENHGYLMKGVIEKLLQDGHTLEYACYSSNKDSDENFQEENKNLILKKIRVSSPQTYKNIFRIIDMIYFCLYSFFYYLFKKKNFDYVVVASSHIVFLGLTGLILSKIHNAKFIYRVEDLTINNELNSKGIKNILLLPYFYLEKFVYYSAYKILTLSDDMIFSINEIYSKPLNNIQKIPNLPRTTKKIDDEISHSIFEKDKDTFRLIFVGNLGKVQGLDLIIKAMRLLRNERIELIFLGSGSQEKFLKKISKDLINKNIHFISFKSNDFASKLISTSDLGIISLKPGVEKNSFPSKLSSYLDGYCPILGIVQKNSELYNMINDEDIGKVIEYGNEQNLSDKILECSRIENFKLKFRGNIDRLLKNYFSPRSILDQWSLIFKSKS